MPRQIPSKKFVDDPTAWSVQVDGRYRLSFDPAGNLDWSADILLLRLLDHDDLYRVVR